MFNTYLEVAKKESNKLEGHFATIFNGIDVIKMRSRDRDMRRICPKLAFEIKSRNTNEVWAIYAATLGENYDIQTLLQAALELVRRRTNIKIFIVGEGPLGKDVSNFVKEKRSANIVYLGKLDPDELFELYQFCDIGICAYGKESNVAMPDKAYDYMAAGLPIVNSLRGELERLLRDHQMGIHYRAGNPKSLADALEELALDTHKRLAMAKNSYNAAMIFDKHVQYLSFLDLLKQVTGQRD